MKKAILILAAFTLLSPIFAFSVTAQDTERKLVALTFDDGPHKTHTHEILSTLERYNVKATFFLVGENAERYPELVKEIASGGHEIGNHTYSHPKIKDLSDKELKDELLKNEDLIFSITGIRTKLFRPPCGMISESVSNIAKEGGYRLVLWNVDTRDWEHKSKNMIVKCVTENVKPGAIILMHDFIGGETHTPEALAKIIETLRAEGYEFVTVSELYETLP